MGTEGGENKGKPSYYNLPPDIDFTLFTPIKGRIDSLTVYIYQEAAFGPQGGLIYMYDT
jgi:hypothetical protein